MSYEPMKKQQEKMSVSSKAYLIMTGIMAIVWFITDDLSFLIVGSMGIMGYWGDLIYETLREKSQ